jgi:hypothetical protein
MTSDGSGSSDGEHSDGEEDWDAADSDDAHSMEDAANRMSEDLEMDITRFMQYVCIIALSACGVRHNRALHSACIRVLSPMP